jgi:hypothetical protein
LYARLLGVGLIYGLGFALVKSFFPTPILLLLFSGGPSSEGNLSLVAFVYLASGPVAGVVCGLLFGPLLLRRRGSRADVSVIRVPPTSGADLWRSLILSFVCAMLIGLVSGLIVIGAYLTGILPSGGVLDPISLIRSSNFPAGYPILVVWTLARDLLPGMLTGLLLAPFGGGFLYRIYYASKRLGEDAPQSSHSFKDDF